MRLEFYIALLVESILYQRPKERNGQMPNTPGLLLAAAWLKFGKDREKRTML